MFQKCPVCDGLGSVTDYSGLSTSKVCTVCKGCKIIDTVTGLPPSKENKSIIKDLEDAFKESGIDKYLQQTHNSNFNKELEVFGNMYFPSGTESANEEKELQLFECDFCNTKFEDQDMCKKHEITCQLPF